MDFERWLKVEFDQYRYAWVLAFPSDTELPMGPPVLPTVNMTGDSCSLFYVKIHIGKLQSN